MRLAVILLLVLPAYAAAQPSPSASVLKLPTPLAPPVAIHPAPQADHKTPPSSAKPTPPKLVSPKPGASKPGASKPGTPAPSPPKPGPAKPGSPKPPAPKPAPGKPVHKPAPAPKPAPAVVAPAPVEAAPAEPAKGSNTGLPLPRFAALRSDDVNFRSGPGTRYPIDWVYKRRDLPVEIEREFDLWRLVRDPLGNKGWVNQATLTGRRTAVVSGAERVLRQSANDTAGAVAKLQVGVILRLRSCEAASAWCQAQIGDYRGYIRRTEIWGVTTDEVIQ